MSIEKWKGRFEFVITRTRSSFGQLDDSLKIINMFSDIV